MSRYFFALLFSLLMTTGAEAHSMQYQVENRGVSARLFYAPDQPVDYSSYEILGPGDTIPHQKGRTDKNGIVSFLPDRPGKWLVKVIGESDHGGHAAQVEIEVNEGLLMESFKKPLIATHTSLVVAISLILGVFGIWVLWTSRKKRPVNTDQKAG
jgi:nickel transport protein